MSQRDPVDVIVAQWQHERPDLDSSTMGIIGRIDRLSPILDARLTRVFSAHGLDFPGFDVLASLRRSGAPYELTPSQLAASMMVTPGAVTQRLARLEGQGLIERTHSTSDRRKVTVSLTPLGLRTVDEAVADHCRNEQAILSIYTAEERAVLVDLLRRLLIQTGGGVTPDAEASEPNACA
jgi:DNA-binding MarR family transcriptional regulator